MWKILFHFSPALLSSSILLSLLLPLVFVVTFAVDAAGVTLSILPSNPKTILSDRQYAFESVQISGEVCQGCSLQIGPNFTITSSSLTLNLTLNAGANITFTNFSLVSSSSTGLTAIFVLHESTCSLSTSRSNDFNFAIQNSRISSSVSFGDAHALDMLSFTGPTACHSPTTELPHLHISIASSTLAATTTEISFTENTAAAFSFRNRNRAATSTTDFIPLVDVIVEDSTLESYRAGNSLASTLGNSYGLYIEKSPLATMRVERCFVSSSNARGSDYYDSAGIFIIYPNQRYTSSFPNSMSLYEVDIVLSNNTYVTVGGRGMTNSVRFEAEYFARFWVLHSNFTHVMTGDDLSESSSVVVMMLRYESNRTMRELNWDIPKYFRTVGTEPEVNVGAITVYNITIHQRVTPGNVPNQIELTNGHFDVKCCGHLRNVTFANISAYCFRGAGTVTTIMFNQLWNAHTVVIQNVIGEYHDVPVHAFIRSEDFPFFVRNLVVDNVTFIRRGDSGHSNVLYLSCTFRGDTVVRVSSIRSYWYGRAKVGNYDVSNSLSTISLAGLKSVYFAHGYLESASNSSAATVTFVPMEGTTSEAEIVVDNVSCYGSGAQLATGIGVVGGTAFGSYGVVPSGAPGLKESTVRNVTVKNSHFDLFKFAKPGLSCALALAGVNVLHYYFSNVHVADTTIGLNLFPLTRGSIDSLYLLRPCSYFGSNGGMISTRAEAAQLTASLTSKPKTIVFERCTETKSFKFRQRTDTGSVVTESLSLSRTRVPTRTKTKIPTRTATYDPPPVSAQLSERVKAVIGATTTLAAAGAIAGGVPGVALDAGRAIATLTTISRCASYRQALAQATTDSTELVRQQFVDDYLTRPLPFPESPFPSLCFGDARGSCVRGAAMSNWIIVLLVFVAATGAGAYRYLTIQKASLRDESSETDDAFVVVACEDDGMYDRDAGDGGLFVPIPGQLCRKTSSFRHGSGIADESSRSLNSPTSSASSAIQNCSNSRASTDQRQVAFSLLSTTSSKENSPRLSPKTAAASSTSKKFTMPVRANLKGLERETSFASLTSNNTATDHSYELVARRKKKRKESDTSRILLLHQKRLALWSWARYPYFVGQCCAVLVPSWAQVAAALIAAPNVPGGDMFVWGLGSLLIWLVFLFFFAKIIFHHVAPLKTTTTTIKKRTKYKNKRKRSEQNNDDVDGDYDFLNGTLGEEMLPRRSPSDSVGGGGNGKGKRRCSSSSSLSGRAFGSTPTNSPRSISSTAVSPSSSGEFNYTSYTLRQERSPWRLEESFINFGSPTMPAWKTAIGRFLRSDFGRWLLVGTIVWAEGDRNGAEANGRPGTLLWQCGSVVNKYRGPFEIERPREERKTPKGKKLSESRRNKFDDEFDTRVYSYDDSAISRLCPYAFGINAVFAAVTGFVAGLAAVQPETCDGVTISQIAVAAINLFVTLRLRPYLIPSKNYSSALADLLLFVGTIVAQSLDDQQQSGFGVSIVIMSTVVSALSGVLSGAKRVLFFLCKGSVTVRGEMWQQLQVSLARLFGGVATAGAQAGL